MKVSIGLELVVDLVKRGGEHPSDGDLHAPTRTGPGEQRGILGEVESLLDRGPVSIQDRLLRARVSHGPQSGDGLGRGERRVEPRHRRRTVAAEFDAGDRRDGDLTLGGIQSWGSFAAWAAIRSAAGV